MKKIARKPEVEIYEKIYRNCFGFGNNIVSLPKDFYFEGGDLYIHNKTIYIGVGSRTKMKSALHIFKSLKKLILKLHYDFIIVEDTKVNNRSNKEQMDFMHLDCFSNPIDFEHIVVCNAEGNKRKVKQVFLDKQGIVKIKKLNKSFVAYLKEKGETIIKVTRKEQTKFACNFLTINRDTIMIPTKTSLNRRLENMGKIVVYVPLKECIKAYGALHCMTSQILRIKK